MARWREYHLVGSVEEALRTLAAYNGSAQVIAGGTDLLIDLDEGRVAPPAALVDISRVDEMRGIEHDRGYIYLGAATTHAEIVDSPLLREHATCLVESCGVIGGPQVRNVATIGGNVAHALPAADGTVSLVALDAEAEVARLDDAGRVQRAWHPILDLFLGPGKSAVDHTRELIVRFRFPARAPREGSAFDRIMRPQGVALPILGVAAHVRLCPDLAHYEQVRLCIGPAGPVPFRARGAEAVLAGRPVTEDALNEAIAAALREAHLRTSKYRATKEYREEMVRVLLRRVLPRAVARAREA